MNMIVIKSFNLRNTDTVKEWNTTLAEAKTLIKLSDKHQITYQVIKGRFHTKIGVSDSK